MSRVFRHLLVAVLMLIPFTLVGELAVRVQRYGWMGLSPDAMGTMALTLQSEFALEAHDRKELGTQGLRPGHRGRLKGAPFEVNALGFRGAEVSAEKPPGTRRIAVLGGSVTLAAGIPLESTWPYGLERLLQADETGDRRDEVLNLAMPKTNASLALHLERALSFNPDLVLWQLSPKDADRRRGHETRPSKNLRIAAEFASRHRLPVLAFTVAGGEFAPPESADEYFSLIDGIEVDFGPEHYLFPIDPHPDGTIHREYARRLHAALRARDDVLTRLLFGAPHTRPSSWAALGLGPYPHPMDGFLDSHLRFRVRLKWQDARREFKKRLVRLEKAILGGSSEPDPGV